MYGSFLSPWEMDLQLNMTRVADSKHIAAILKMLLKFYVINICSDESNRSDVCG